MPKWDYRAMEEALAKVTSFSAVYSQNDDMILGAIEAMEKADIPPEKILTIGTDAIPKALIAIRESPVRIYIPVIFFPLF